MAERTHVRKPRPRSVLDNNLPGRSVPTAPPPSSPSTTTTSATAQPSPSGPSPSSHPIETPPPPPSSSIAPLTTEVPGSASSRPTASSTTYASAPAHLPHRVTRASARLSAKNPPELAASPSVPDTEVTRPAVFVDHTQQPRASRPSSSSTPKQPHTKKRKAVDVIHQPTASSSRRSKRQKSAKPRSPTLSSDLPLPSAGPTRSRKGRSAADMSSPGSGAGPSDGANKAQNKKSARVSKSGPSSADRARRTAHQFEMFEDQDTVMTGTDDVRSERTASHRQAEDDQDSDSVDNGVDGDADDDGDEDEDGENQDDEDDNDNDNNNGNDDDEDEDEDEDDDLRHYTGSAMGDPFSGSFGRSSGLPAALSMLGGMLSMSGMGGRLRDILNSLRQKDDPTAQLIALQDLSEILLVSNEDNLIGSFSPDSFVRELVTLMQPNEITGEENPEIMLLACRCLANLMEAIPASAANVVYGGAVPVLCQKLVDITFIDFAEQALSTLEKISVEYPTSIVREGGLSACLSYLEFFPTSTQRTAVTTAANCCRNIPLDSFSVVRDAMHILLNVLNSNDQRVVEQAALCVSRIVESFKHFPSKLEDLVGVDLLKVILRLLLPGSSNHLIGPSLHTQFLRVLAITANNSPRLAAELFKMNVVETLYQILTGVSPPSGTDNIAAKLDSVLIMQALIHRPREQIIETLNVVCHLLPAEVDITHPGPTPGFARAAEAHGGGSLEDSGVPVASRSQKKHSLNEKRLELLGGCKEEVRRFTLIMFPTLMDAYSSTVNLEVRLRVLAAQIKMLSNFDRDIILEALKAVPYASFLASILSQQDHPSLVISALQATELLMARLGDVYRYQLYREGVINEIEKLVELQDKTISGDSTADDNHDPESLALATAKDKAHLHPPDPVRPQDDGYRFSPTPVQEEKDNRLADDDANSSLGSDGLSGQTGHDVDIEDGESDDEAEAAAPKHFSRKGDSNGDDDDDHHLDDDHANGEADDDHEDDDEHGDDEEDEEGHDLEGRLEQMAGSPTSSGNSTASDEPSLRHYHSFTPSRAEIVTQAKRFLDRHEADSVDNEMRAQATQTLSTLTQLAAEISQFYLEQKPTASLDRGVELFERLANFFDSDVFESATSAELLGSGVVNVLERVFSNSNEDAANAAQSAFLQTFMGHPVRSQAKAAVAGPPITPFSILIHKLQDLLSRSEHFEVVTVHHNTFDGNQTSAASMLAKQIRLRLVAGDDSDVPRAFRSIMVSIHAIATFKTLEDYLRPRISLSDRTKSRADGLSRALAAMAGTGSEPGPASFGASAAERLRNSRAFLAAPEKPPTSHDSPSEVSGLPTSSAAHLSKDTPQTPSPSSHPHASRKAKPSVQTASASAASSASVTEAANDKRSLRRSPRRRPPTSKAEPMAHPPNDDDPLANVLECADEKHLTDENDEEMDMSEANDIDAVVGDLDEDMGDSETPDPSAVDLEVATGGRITARQEDGTRVFTPSQSPFKAAADSRLSALAAALGQSAPPTPSAPGAARPPPAESTAAPAPLASQDWHMEFSLDGKAIPMDSTVYRAVLNSIIGREEHGGRFVWSAVHTVNYRRVPGPNPPEPAGLGFPDNANNDMESPDSSGAQGPLVKNPTALSILRLLKTLHDLNAHVDDIVTTNKESIKLNAEPLLQFVNTKLTAKLNRQLEEPLIVASNCLPNWSEDLARLYPFLFPFETRHLFLQSTSFGYARSMARWQNAQVQEESRRERRDERPFLGRLQRQKVRISRSKILESAVKVMELYGASQSILEVEYFGEVGTGLGPTLEFYSTVSREFAKKKLKLWRDNDPGDSEFVSGPNGLFPRPLSDEGAAGTNGERIMCLFRALGKFVARSMLDSRIIDINFNPIFFRIGDDSSSVRPSLGAVKIVDPTLARSLLLIKKFDSARKAIDEDPTRSAAEKVQAIASITVNDMSIDDLSLDFTLPGYPEIELVSGGSDISVNIDNVGMYIDKVIAMTLGGGVRRQVDAFRKGFSEVFPYPALSAFTPTELVSLFGRNEEDWSLETLMDSIKADHGFTMDSRSVKNLLQAMSEMSLADRRSFLQFTTGSPRLPIGGFRSLTPMFTVVCKPSEAPYTSDDYLPSVMTCVNYLKLPDYTSIEVLKKQLSLAVKEGQGAFHLS